MPYIHHCVLAQWLAHTEVSNSCLQVSGSCSHKEQLGMVLAVSIKTVGEEWFCSINPLLERVPHLPDL